MEAIEKFAKVEGVEEKVSRYCKFHELEVSDVMVDGEITPEFSSRLFIQDGRLFEGEAGTAPVEEEVGNKGMGGIEVTTVESEVELGTDETEAGEEN